LLTMLLAEALKSTIKPILPTNISASETIPVMIFANGKGFFAVGGLATAA